MDTVGDDECDIDLVLETEAWADTEMVADVDTDPELVAELVSDVDTDPELVPEVVAELEPEADTEMELDNDGVAVILTVAVFVLLGNKQEICCVWLGLGLGFGSRIVL